MGSVERFFGVLIEHYAGAFPAWLAPVQVSVLPISEKTIEYAREVENKMGAAGFRVHLDDRNEKIQAKIRDAQMQKIPYMLVVGAKEAAAGTVAVRHRTKGDWGRSRLRIYFHAARPGGKPRRRIGAVKVAVAEAKQYRGLAA